MWQFRLTERDWTPLATVTNAYERKYVANLSKPSTAGFNVRQDNPILEYLFNYDSPVLLQVWEDTTLRYWGPIISSNFAMTEGGVPSVAVSSADAGWYMSRRLCGKSEKGTEFKTTDFGTIAHTLITTAGEESPLPVAPGSGTSGSTGTYTAGPYKPLLSAIQDLANGIDGFDWYIEPTEIESVPLETKYIGIFHCAAVVGEEKPSAIFEFGTGKRNMRSMNFLQDISTEVNRAYNIDENGLEASLFNPTPVVRSEDTTSEDKNFRLEEVVELPGVNNVGKREEWTDENVRVRKEPRRILGLTSDIDDGTGRVPQFGTDYWLGDIVTARAVTAGRVLFNGQTRVYAVEVSLDNAGTASITPILVEEAEA